MGIMGSYNLMGVGFQFGMMEKVLELGSGDGCTTM